MVRTAEFLAVFAAMKVSDGALFVTVEIFSKSFDKILKMKDVKGLGWINESSLHNAVFVFIRFESLIPATAGSSSDRASVTEGKSDKSVRFVQGGFVPTTHGPLTRTLDAAAITGAARDLNFFRTAYMADFTEGDVTFPGLRVFLLN